MTAAHVFDDVPNAQLAIPISDGDSELWTLSATRAAKTDVAKEDVYVLELEAKILDRISRGGYRAFLGSENVAAAESDLLLAFGYRLGDLKTNQNGLGAEPTLISARRYTGSTDNVKGVSIAWYDLLLEWEKDLSLRGISGSPLWTMQEVEGVWTAEKAMKLVGVQTGAVAGTWIRGTQWAVVTRLIEQLAATASGS